RTLIKTKASHSLSAHDTLSRVSDDLALDNPSMMFVTLFLGILDVTTGEMEYANAGHNPPYLISGQGRGIEPLESTGGLALGVMPGIPYRSRHLVLKPGETLFIYTDGVTEAINAREALFSESRLEQGLTSLKAESMDQMVTGVMSLVQAFSQGVPQADDITLMALRYNGKENTAPGIKARDLQNSP
nr:serine/threonine-protein phosphatase [Desulfobacula sp.]